jgi:coenzyme Q-binding protein COQ10
MHKFSETKILPHNYQDLYELVLDVEKYPEFLPWVEETKIISRTSGELIADMTVNFKAIRQSYRSKVSYKIDEHGATIAVDATSGLFKHLHNSWIFTTNEKDTTLQFNIDFEFQSKIIDTIASPLFTAISKEMIVAFEKRAMEKYCGNKNN